MGCNSAHQTTENPARKKETWPPNCPALALIARHDAKHVDQRRTEPKNDEDFDEIGQRRRILEWVRAVLPKKSATVGAELFDCDLRGGRSERNLLDRTLHRGCRCVAMKRLHDALLHEDQGKEDRKRQQDVECAAGEIGPEISELLPCLRTSPRTNATAIATPVAALTKLCTASPAIWVK